MIIALIGSVASRPFSAIIKSLLVVLIVKITISPHSPLPAYFAVTFQGLCGAILFSTLPFRFAAMLLGVLALVESVFQKLITLTLLFGKSLWESVDIFTTHILDKLGVGAEASISGAQYIIGSYIGLYFICGFIVGWLAGLLPAKVQRNLESCRIPDDLVIMDIEGRKKIRKPLWKRKQFKWILGTAIMIAGIYFFIPTSQSILQPVMIMGRAIAVIGLWYVIVSPLLTSLLLHFLRKKETHYKQDVQSALDLIPVFKTLMYTAWKETSEFPKLTRWSEALTRGIAYCLMYQTTELKGNG